MVYVYGNRDEMSRYVCLSLYIREVTSVFEISVRNFANVLFFSRSCSFMGKADIGSLYHISDI